MSKLRRAGLALVAAIALMTGLPGLSHAGVCGGGAIQDVELSNADCVSHSAKKIVKKDPNTGMHRFLTKHTFTNSCWGYGTVTAYSTAFERNRVFTFSKAKEVANSLFDSAKSLCCKYPDTICNISEAVNTTSCTEKFDSSPAADDCSLSADPTVTDNVKCEFSWSCAGATSGATTVNYNDAGRLRFCDGDMTTAESC